MAGKITQNTTYTGRGLNKSKSVISTETTDTPGVSITTEKHYSSIGSKLHTGSSIFALVVCFLLIISIIRSLAGGSSVSFTGFLEYLSNAPSVSMNLTTINSFEITSSWVVDCGLFVISFDWLRNFFNIFIGILNLLVFCFKGLWQVALYLIYFLKFIFV